MRSDGISVTTFDPRHRPTPHVWAASRTPGKRLRVFILGSLLAAAVLVSASCATSREAPAEQSPIQDDEQEIVRLQQALADEVEKRLVVEAEAAELARENDELSSAKRRFDNEIQALSADIESLRKNLESAEEENAVLRRLVNDMLLAQGILRPTGDVGAQVPVPAPESTADPPPPVNPPAPSVATPQAQADSTPGPILEQTLEQKPEVRPERRPSGRSDGVVTATPSTSEGGRSTNATVLPATPPVASGDLVPVEDSRAATASHLQVHRDLDTGTMRYSDDRLAYDAPSLAFLTVQVAPDRSPTLYLHLRINQGAGGRTTTPQIGLLTTVEHRIRLDASNSAVIRVGSAGSGAELLAVVSPRLVSVVTTLIRLGGEATVESIAGSVTFSISAAERVAMANMLYTFQDLGGILTP